MRNHRFHRLLIIGLCSLVILLGATEELNNGETEEQVFQSFSSSVHPYRRLYEEMLYPTVRIETPQGVGSGVVISIEHRAKSIEQIAILTAAHVVGNQSTVEVEFFSPSVLQSASVVITDTVKDLALLRLKPNPDGHRDQTLVWTARLAPRDYKPYLFTAVWVVGCSLGLDPRPSYGHITAIETNHEQRITNYEVSAPILPGNSGGPVYDAKTHKLIGLAVWVRVYDRQLITTMAGVVPISVIYDFIEGSELGRKLISELVPD